MINGIRDLTLFKRNTFGQSTYSFPPSNNQKYDSKEMSNTL